MPDETYLERLEREGQVSPGSRNMPSFEDRMVREYGDVLPAFGKTAGEALRPDLNPVGGEFNAQDYILRNLQSKGPESLPQALALGAAEGLTRLTVPRTGVDLAAQGLATASGGAAELAGALRGGQGASAAARGLGKLEQAARKDSAARGDYTLASGRPKPRGYFNPSESSKVGYKGPGGRYQDVGKATEELASRRSARVSGKPGASARGQELAAGKIKAGRLGREEQLAEGVKKMKGEQLEEGKALMQHEELGKGLERMPEAGVKDITPPAPRRSVTEIMDELRAQIPNMSSEDLAKMVTDRLL